MTLIVIIALTTGIAHVMLDLLIEIMHLIILSIMIQNQNLTVL
jgi:hypothetical protein